MQRYFIMQKYYSLTLFIYGWMVRFMDGWMDGWVYGWKDGRTDRQPCQHSSGSYKSRIDWNLLEAIIRYLGRTLVTDLYFFFVLYLHIIYISRISESCQKSCEFCQMMPEVCLHAHSV